jgi:hypothetical protein
VRHIEIPATCATRVLSYLNAPVERMAFLLADQTTEDHWTVRAELYLDDSEDYEYQGPFGMALADGVRPWVLQWATQNAAALIEVHSHGVTRPTSTTFSPTDLTGLQEIVPQLLWRLRGLPYAALVLGSDDLDALAWSRRSEALVVPDFVIMGERRMAPTGVAINQLIEPEYST